MVGSVIASQLQRPWFNTKLGLGSCAPSKKNQNNHFILVRVVVYPKTILGTLGVRQDRASHIPPRNNLKWSIQLILTNHAVIQNSTMSKTMNGIWFS